MQLQLNHTTKIIPYTFELLEVKLKKLKKLLTDAEWNNDSTSIKNLKEQIHSIEYSISVGEKYDVPF